MSLAIGWREDWRGAWLSLNFRTVWEPYVYDPNGRDGEWSAVVTLEHEAVEHEGRVVPEFVGDVERLEWVPSSWTRTRPRPIAPVGRGPRIDLAAMIHLLAP